MGLRVFVLMAGYFLFVSSTSPAARAALVGQRAAAAPGNRDTSERNASLAALPEPVTLLLVAAGLFLFGYRRSPRS